jgi:hypothetical protein
MLTAVAAVLVGQRLLPQAAVVGQVLRVRGAMRLAQQVELLGQMEGLQGHRLVGFPMQIQILAARAAAEGL